METRYLGNNKTAFFSIKSLQNISTSTLTTSLGNAMDPALGAIYSCHGY